MNADQFLTDARSKAVDTQAFIDSFHEAIKEFGIEEFAKALVESELIPA